MNNHVAALALVASSVAVFGQGASYAPVDKWVQDPGAGQAEWEMAAVSVTPDGSRVSGFRRSDPPLVELDASGRVVKTWGEGMFAWPHGVYVDREGYIWATDGTTGPGTSPAVLARKLAQPLAPAVKGGYGHQVFKFSPDGKVVMTLGTKGVAGETPATFNAPTDVEVAPNGDIFVSDGHVNARVLKFSKDGRFLKAWGTRGPAEGEFSGPHALAMDSQGRLFVGDRGNRRIQLFSQDGAFIAAWPHPRPSGLAIAPGDILYVADDTNRVVDVLSARDGSKLGVITDVGAEGVAVDNHGNVYASEVDGRRIVKFQRK